MLFSLPGWTPERYSFFVRAVEKWNKLPEEVGAAPSKADKRICEKPKFNEKTTFENEKPTGTYC